MFTNNEEPIICTENMENKCHSHENIKFVSIEGNIGAGKTTLFKKIQNFIDEYELNKDGHIVYLREPVDVWENMKDANGKNILELFYENPKKYAFEFQTMALASQCKLVDETLQKNPHCKIILSERSFDAGHNVFTKMLVEDEFISDIQYEIYKFMLNNRIECVNAKHTGKPDKIIYLDVEPSICKKRICERSREGEESISLNYLEKCKKKYDEWLENEMKDVVLTINDDCEMEEIIKHIL